MPQPKYKRSISAPEWLFALADKRQAMLRYENFSEYIQALLIADTHGVRPHQRLSFIVGPEQWRWARKTGTKKGTRSGKHSGK